MTIKYQRTLGKSIQWITEVNSSPSDDAGRATEIEAISGVDPDSIVIE